MVECLHWLVLGRVLLVNARWHRLDDRVVVRPCEKGIDSRGAEAAAEPAGGFITRWTVRLPPVRPDFIKVADVHDKGVGGGAHRVPFTDFSRTWSPPASMSPMSDSSWCRIVKPV